jgi:hypothetical protein
MIPDTWLRVDGDVVHGFPRVGQAGQVTDCAASLACLASSAP